MVGIPGIVMIPNVEQEIVDIIRAIGKMQQFLHGVDDETLRKLDGFYRGVDSPTVVVLPRDLFIQLLNFNHRRMDIINETGGR